MGRQWSVRVKNIFRERCISIHAYNYEAVHYFPFVIPLTMVDIREKMTESKEFCVCVCVCVWGGGGGSV